MVNEEIKLSVKRNQRGQIIQVFFDNQHEEVTYEELTNNQNFELSGGTAFQQAVWLELQKIPAGTTISYQEMAARVGSPQAQQAVGQALARNPLPVILPCHRVTRKDGSLGGFMGQEDAVHIKQKILEYEKNLNRK
ncbi:MGMT family protein [Lactococcus muris]|uniref:MGMT family protein n=1 Tax=Lactococcus muris TaxID=2941330 RepID=A0ABV4D7G8_9LACT|nr:methylated-DNA--[protein]-cysteine S-methyltransferase [Lactococcus garvieae]HAP16002.1 hypothetical protein [Lactococcus sp.]